MYFSIISLIIFVNHRLSIWFVKLYFFECFIQVVTIVINIKYFQNLEDKKIKSRICSTYFKLFIDDSFDIKNNLESVATLKTLQDRPFLNLMIWCYFKNTVNWARHICRLLNNFVNFCTNLLDMNRIDTLYMLILVCLVAFLNNE